jgi:glycerophosphoryl diester phosphodiesterase
LLEDLLGVWPDIRVSIDAKHEAAVPPLVAALERTRAHSRVCVGAFSNRRVEHIRRLSGDSVCTWMGHSQILRLRLASLGLPIPAFVASCAQVPVRYGPVLLVDRRFIDEAHRRGVAVHVWTIDNRAEMERLLNLGVDGILSNRPSVLKDVFIQRGIWVLLRLAHIPSPKRDDFPTIVWPVRLARISSTRRRRQKVWLAWI